MGSALYKKVLVVDDEPEIINLIKYTLDEAGFEVHSCNNGHDAWDEINLIIPDVLVLDVMLPGMDGHALQSKLAKYPGTKNIPIVILTSLESARKTFELIPQVVAFLTKPFTPEVLVQAVQSASQRNSGG